MNQAEERVRLLEANLLDLATALARGTAGKIHAIKAYRAATGTALKESKDWVEALAQFAEKSSTPREDRLDQLERRMEALERDKTQRPLGLPTNL